MNAITTTRRQALEPQTLNEAMQFAKMLATSTMVPRDFQNRADNILVAVQWGREIGLGPLQALQNIAVINGRPSVWGDAALALVRGSGVCQDVQESIAGEGDRMVATCVAMRKGASPVTGTFSVADAMAAGLWGKAGPWKQYPKRMLQMRARGFALRDAFPDVLKGVITAEEAQDTPFTRQTIDHVAPETAGPLVTTGQILGDSIPALDDPPAPTVDRIAEGIGKVRAKLAVCPDMDCIDQVENSMLAQSLLSAKAPPEVRSAMRGAIDGARDRVRKLAEEIATAGEDATSTDDGWPGGPT